MNKIQFILKILSSLSNKLPLNPIPKIPGEHPRNVACDLVRRNSASTRQQSLVRISERVGDLFARVFPLVDQLLEHARIGVLRDETRAQQLQSLASDLRDDRRVIQKPPATKRHQIVKISRRHTQLVLVLARKKCG